MFSVVTIRSTIADSFISHHCGDCYSKPFRIIVVPEVSSVRHDLVLLSLVSDDKTAMDFDVVVNEVFASEDEFEVRDF